VGMAVGSVRYHMRPGHPPQGVARAELLAPPIRELLHGLRQDRSQAVPFIPAGGAEGRPDAGIR